MEINNRSFDDSIRAETEDGISESSPVNWKGPCFETSFAGDLDEVVEALLIAERDRQLAESFD